jgi:hypothetical protein
VSLIKEIAAYLFSLFVGLYEGLPSYRRLLKREHPELQHMKFLTFFFFESGFGPDA